MARSKTVQLNIILYLISTIFLYVLVTFSLLVPEWIGARKSPFACNDYSIRNPLKKQTVSTLMLILITVLATILIIIVTEFIIDRHSGSDHFFKFQKYYLPALLVHIIAFLGYFQLGYVMQIVVNQVTKYAVGRLRPHFYTVCQPINFTCVLPEQLIYDYTCTGNKKEFDEARLSFYSGHSSISMYTVTFLALYLHARIGHIAPRVILSTLQTLLFSGGLFICYTRLQDYFHHPSDIATGMAVGIIGAFYSCFAWADMWQQRGNYSAVHGKLIEEEDASVPSAVKVDTKSTQPKPGNSEQPPPNAQIYHQEGSPNVDPLFIEHL
ncbi:hypothetical protein PRIPAC_90634 [Pristionchus pacificus]|nr:hypothetical protein PRIPAC_90634 [Pristionchus pacificus]